MTLSDMKPTGSEMREREIKKEITHVSVWQKLT